jgi:hypothetical protein
MSDKIGVLGEASATAVSTATVYTCPAGKAAKVRIMARFQGDTSSQVAFLVNGMEVARNAAMTASHYNYTIRGDGLLSYAAGNASAPNGVSDALTVAPADPVYFLSAGDTIQYTVIGAALLAMNCQVVGIEIDI